MLDTRTSGDDQSDRAIVLRNVASELRRHREARKMTQGQLAARIGKSVATVSKIESSQQLPDLDTFMAMADALATSPWAILLTAQKSVVAGDKIRRQVLKVFERIMV